MPIARRPNVLIALVATSTAFASRSSLHSKTSIAAGQAFLLGRGQRGRCSAAVTDTGPVPVAVFVGAGGNRRPVIVLAPDSTIDAEFQAQEKAVFSNASSQQAVLRVEIRGGDARHLGKPYDSARRGP